VSGDHNPVVAVHGLTKVFEIPLDRRTRLKDHVVNLFRSPGKRRLEALKGIDLDINRGEFFGVIGPNGSGKSTLLKILAGIYQPSSGSVRIVGRLSPFIELGVGFNFELTARDNVYLSGAILGLRRAQVAGQLDEIIAFAELEDFVDQKLKNYSSGMLVRLAFSIAIRAHAEVLLIDEVLAVGDANFQQKCFEVFRKIKAEGRTIIFVSHDLSAVKEFCDRVLVLDHGRSHGVFSASKAIAEYNQLNEEHARRDLDRARVRDSMVAGAVQPNRPALVNVEMTVGGESQRIVHRGDDVRVALTIDNPQAVPVNAGVAIYRSDGLYCFGTNTFIAGAPATCERNARIDVTFHNLPLHRGHYYLVIGVFGESPRFVFEMHDHISDFQVAQWDEYEGTIYIDHEWKVSVQTGAGRQRPPAARRARTAADRRGSPRPAHGGGSPQ
jgi:ABC-type polysaccharide/polyol phosphate transport system ATPase subunit